MGAFPASPKLNVRVSEDLKAKLEEIAKSKGRRLSDVVHEVLEQALRNGYPKEIVSEALKPMQSSTVSQKAEAERKEEETLQGQAATTVSQKTLLDYLIRGGL